MTDDLWWVEEKGIKQKKDRGLSIREVKAQVSIERVLLHYGSELGDDRFTQRVEWESIRCPFHADSRPSASIHRGLGRFRCHVCDLGGDVIDVVAQAEDLSPKEALAWITTNLL